MSEVKPVAWQWLTTMNFRKKPPASAELSAWRAVYDQAALDAAVAEERERWQRGEHICTKCGLRQDAKPQFDVDTPPLF